jgi:hypothetical protein
MLTSLTGSVITPIMEFGKNLDLCPTNKFRNIRKVNENWDLRSQGMTVEALF